MSTSRKHNTSKRSELFDEFGILRSDDSAALDERSANPTDDDLSQRILDVATASETDSPSIKEDIREIGVTSDSEPLLELSNVSEFHAQLEDLTADLTGFSDDFSRASDLGKKANQAQDSASLHQDETESLTEFEEIERLIKANTVDDSDDDLSDIPEDLEQRILSGRKSRESYRSGTKSENEPSHSVASNYLRKSSSSESGSFPKESCKETHHDTGYMSQGAPNTPNPSNTVHCDEVPQNDFTGGNEASPVIEAEQSLNQDSESSSSSEEEIAQLDRTNETELDVTLDRFMVPTTRTDTNQPNSLVATFGTTQDFEDLLQQQLDDMQSEEVLGQSRESTAETQVTKSTPDNPLTSTRRKRLPDSPETPAWKSGNRSRNSPRDSAGMQVKAKPRSKLQLSSSNKSTPRGTMSSPSQNHTSRSSKSARSPAANRARRKSNAANGRKSTPLLRESSADDMSIRSDISKTELKSKLKEESLNRKREEEMVRELQSNYDSLLMKYALAENTIDHLRLGAKINIFASVPRAQTEDPTLPFEEATLSKQEPEASQRFPQESDLAMHQGPAQPMHHRTPSGAFSTGSKRDSMVENSLQLPSAATTEFLKVALQLQAKDLQDKIDSLNTLLDENALDDEGKHQAMAVVEETLRNLEKDYLNGIDEHAAEQKRIVMATGGTVELEFDPDGLMERDIGRLGFQVGQLRRRVSEGPALQPSPSGLDSARTDNTEVPSSPDCDVDSKFDLLLKRYNRQVPTDDDDATTAPSQYLSSDDDLSPRPLSSRYLRAGGNDTSFASQSSPTVKSPKTNKNKQKLNSSVSRTGENLPSASPSPTRRQSSRLPRPVGRSGRERREPSSEDRKSKQHDKGTDSGFVGSESSRQSAATTPLQPAKMKLVSRPPAALAHQPSPKPRSTDKRDRHASGDTTTTATTNNRNHKSKPPQESSFIDKVGIFKPPPPMHDDSMDDLSTTSTVREALRHRHPSISCSSSTAPSQATAVLKSKHPFPTSSSYPHGSKSGNSLKSRDTRSIASTTKDSTLDAIRGEISKLRDEIKAAKSGDKENLHPIHRSTPRRHSAREQPDTDNETLRALREDIKALKDEVQNQKTHKPDDVDQLSLKSADLDTERSRRSDRGRRSRRSRSLGRDDASETSNRRNDSSPENRRQRHRSRSQTREPWQGGYWTYVPPSHAVSPGWVSHAPPVGRMYTRPASPVLVHTAPAYKAPPVYHVTPVIGNPQTVVFVDQPTTPGRVYVPKPVTQSRVYATPSKPRASVFISPKHSGGSGSIRKASVYIVDDSDEEVPLRRSHLGLRRSSSTSRLHNLGKSSLVVLPDSRLNDSVERAERSAEEIRSHSRQMYRTLRNDVYRSQLMAETM